MSSTKTMPKTQQSLKRHFTVFIDENGEPTSIAGQGVVSLGVENPEDDLWYVNFDIKEGGDSDGEYEFILGNGKMKITNCKWVQHHQPTLKTITFKPLLQGGETLEVMRQRAAEVKKWIERFT